MTTEEFLKLKEELRATAERILYDRGSVYPPNEDRLSNFKEVAEVARRLLGQDMVELSPGFVWFVFYLKQLVPFAKWVMTGIHKGAEPPINRAADLTNYTFLGYAIGAEADALAKTLEVPPALLTGRPFTVGKWGNHSGSAELTTDYPTYPDAPSLPKYDWHSMEWEAAGCGIESNHKRHGRCPGWEGDLSE